MAFYYVKSGGLASGDGGRYASQQTGSFGGLTTSGYYDNIEDVFAATTSPTTSDYILVSDAHVHSEGSSNNWSGVNNTTGHLKIISVSDTNCDQYSAGAEDSAGGSNDLVPFGRLAVWGITSSVGDDMRMGTNNSSMLLVDCALEFTGSGDRLQAGQDGSIFELINTTIDIDQDGYVYVSNGSEFFMRSGSFSAAGQMFQDGFINGGGKVTMEGVDISGFGTSDYLLENVGSSTSADDLIMWELSFCKVSSVVTYHEEALENRNHTWLMTHCGSTAAEAEYAYYYTSLGCTVEDDITVYRDNSDPFASGTKVSYKVITQADINNANLFHFELPAAQHVNLIKSDSDVLTVYFACANVLSDGDVWFDVTYADGTSKHTYNYINSRPSDFLNPTNFTDSGDAWTDTGEVDDIWAGNVYKVSLDTTSDRGTACIVSIRAYVGKASDTIYFCSTVDLS